MFYNDLRIIIDVTCVYFIKITLHFIIEIGIQTWEPILAEHVVVVQ